MTIYLFSVAHCHMFNKHSGGIPSHGPNKGRDRDATYTHRALYTQGDNMVRAFEMPIRPTFGH